MMSRHAISVPISISLVGSFAASLTGALALLADAGCNSSTVDSQISTGGQGQGRTSGGGAPGNNGGDNNAGAGGCGILCATPVGGAGGTTGVPLDVRNCGNGVQDLGEQCDDGNTNNGDGCNHLCQLEANWDCPTPGQPCKNMAVCGNGVLTSDETCDDGNTKSGDGCSGDCKTIEPGWQCRVPGRPCTPLCGDGVITANETCDDGNTQSGDGCSATCKVEMGYTCGGQPSVCTHTTCGDGKVEGAEGCDDGNTMPFDGCSEDCQIEPNCSGASCTSPCGDGIIMGNKQCDDANQASGDGCSKDCTVEPGWTCTQPPLGDKMMVPVIYRDFRFHNPSDFEPGVVGQNTASTGMVQTDLDSDGKPVYANPANPGGAVHVESAATFAEWFRTSTASPPVNHPTASKLALWNNGQGGYVNRYGPNGEQWNVTTPANWCGSVGQELKDANGNAIPCTFQYQQSATNPTGGQTDCQKMEALGYTQLAGSCKADSGGTYKAEYIVAKVDGNPLFFPIDNDPFSADQLTGAQVPSVPLGLYDASGTWPWDVDAAGNKILHNFSFTSEVRYWFKYDSSKTYILDFVGDDDVWVFINKKLAVDLGGIHTPVEGSVTLNAAAATKLGGLKSGNVYEIAVFQDDRQTTCVSFKLTMTGFNAAPSSCVPTCGDGVTVADEECDCGDGTVPVPAGCPGPNNDTTYGGCTSQCKWGPFCGDDTVNGPEQCDLGKLNGSNPGPGGCTFGCTTAHYCGDGYIDTNVGEECDMGSKNGQKLDASGNPSDASDAEIYCTTDCKIPRVFF